MNEWHSYLLLLFIVIVITQLLFLFYVFLVETRRFKVEALRAGLLQEMQRKHMWLGIDGL